MQCNLHGEGPIETTREFGRGYFDGWCDGAAQLVGPMPIDMIKEYDRGYLEGIRDRGAGHRPRKGVDMRCEHLIRWPHECRDCEAAHIEGQAAKWLGNP